MHGTPQNGWLSRAGKYRVEHVPCPNPGQPVSDGGKHKGILHTVEGSFESGLNVFLQHYAPHFQVGRDRKGRVRILQLVPLGTMAAALENHSGGVETNRECRVQIEIADRSKHTPWLPDDGVTDALATLMAELRHAQAIPLHHPPVRRDPRMWEAASGWMGHIDVPENVHWDSGAIRYERLFTLAHRQETKPRKPPKVKPKPQKKILHPKIWALQVRARRAEPAPLCPKEDE